MSRKEDPAAIAARLQEERVALAQSVEALQNRIQARSEATTQKGKEAAALFSGSFGKIGTVMRSHPLATGIVVGGLLLAAGVMLARNTSQAPAPELLLAELVSALAEPSDPHPLDPDLTLEWHAQAELLCERAARNLLRIGEDMLEAEEDRALGLGSRSASLRDYKAAVIADLLEQLDALSVEGLSDLTEDEAEAVSRQRLRAYGDLDALRDLAQRASEPQEGGLGGGTVMAGLAVAAASALLLPKLRGRNASDLAQKAASLLHAQGIDVSGLASNASGTLNDWVESLRRNLAAKGDSPPPPQRAEEDE